jgi:hypothetical protein
MEYLLYINYRSLFNSDIQYLNNNYLITNYKGGAASAITTSSTVQDLPHSIKQLSDIYTYDELIPIIKLHNSIFEKLKKYNDADLLLHIGSDFTKQFYAKGIITDINCIWLNNNDKIIRYSKIIDYNIIKSLIIFYKNFTETIIHNLNIAADSIVYKKPISIELTTYKNFLINKRYSELDEITKYIKEIEISFKYSLLCVIEQFYFIIDVFNGLILENKINLWLTTIAYYVMKENLSTYDTIIANEDISRGLYISYINSTMPYPLFIQLRNMLEKCFLPIFFHFNNVICKNSGKFLLGRPDFF